MCIGIPIVIYAVNKHETPAVGSYIEEMTFRIGVNIYMFAIKLSFNSIYIYTLANTRVLLSSSRVYMRVCV